MQFVDRIKDNVTPRQVASLIGGLCVAYVLVLRFQSTSLRNIHWDEFNFLRYVYRGLSGELPRQLSFHSHLFSWLPILWDHEVDQIIWGRRALVVLQTSSWVALWLIGRKLLDSLSALVGLAALFSVTYCIMYGIEFRYDTLITSLAIWSCAINLVVRHRIGLVISGVLYSVAMLSSLKAAVFCLPILITLIVSPDEDLSWKQTVRRVFYFGSGFAGSYLWLGGFHLWSAGNPVKDLAPTAAVLADKMFYSDARFPEIRAFQETLQHDRFAWVLFFSGMVLSSAGIYYCDGKERRRNLVLFSLAMPFLVLPFYRNAYPYFYNTILPGVAVGAAAFLAPSQSETHQRSREATKVIAALGLIFFFTLEARQMHSLNNADRVTHVREVITAVKEVFPEPTPYIDRAGMITSYPKIGPFMTIFHMRRYRRAEGFWVKMFIEKHGARFVLNNITALDLSRESLWTLDKTHSFPKTDVRVLKENFVHHWGPLWVLGKKLKFDAAGEEQTAEFLVPGTYTLSTGDPVTFGDRSLRPWDTVQLEKGRHTFVASTPGEVVFKWGDNLRLPQRKPPSDRLFDGFAMVPRP